VVTLCAMHSVKVRGVYEKGKRIAKSNENKCKKGARKVNIGVSREGKNLIFTRRWVRTYMQRPPWLEVE
jgi:hypothetical protein